MNRQMPAGCLALLLFILLFLLRLYFTDIILVTLGALGLSPKTAILVVISIFLGGLINIPITRIQHHEPFSFDQGR